MSRSILSFILTSPPDEPHFVCDGSDKYPEAPGKKEREPRLRYEEQEWRSGNADQ